MKKFMKYPLPAIKSPDNPNGMDPECMVLCTAINKLRGIATYESCCGHGEQPYRVWVFIRSLPDLPKLLYWLDSCHTGAYGWHVIVYTDCAMSPARFMIEGPVGEVAYRDSEHIAKLIEGNL